MVQLVPIEQVKVVDCNRESNDGIWKYGNWIGVTPLETCQKCEYYVGYNGSEVRCSYFCYSKRKVYVVKGIHCPKFKGIRTLRYCKENCSYHVEIITKPLSNNWTSKLLSYIGIGNKFVVCDWDAKKYRVDSMLEGEYYENRGMLR